LEGNEINSHKSACIIAQFLDDKLAKDITILNISHVSSLADFFVIATGDSTPQVKALMETVKEKVKNNFSRLPIRNENDLKNRWNLLDYGDVVVHILHKEERENYALEKFWSHAFSVSETEWRKEASEYSEYKQKK
jgi:ribosome-associated protein